MRIISSTFLLLVVAASFVSRPIRAEASVCGRLQPSMLTSTAVQRANINAAAKVAIEQRQLCLITGDSVFILPTVSATYFAVDKKAGVLRSRTRTFLKPASISQTDNGTILRFDDGTVRKLPANTLIDSTSAGDYEVVIQHQGRPIASFLANMKPVLVSP